MKPKDAKTKRDWCSKECKYLKEYQHPFFFRNAWCDYLLRELFYYDGWYIAGCKFKEPDETLLKVLK
jgi:hypothetical protein